jgi:hypothetical protein
MVIGGNFKYPSKKFVTRDIIANGQAATLNGVIIVLSLFASRTVNNNIVKEKTRLGI